MAEHAELEIGLRRGDNGGYNVELRFADPGNESVTWIGFDKRFRATFDSAQLVALANDPLGYGAVLTDSLFNEPDIRGAFERARALTQESDLPLRLRLIMDTGELHGLRWETLLDPQSRAPLATSERVLLSRYPRSDDFEIVKLRSKGDLSALVVVANPPQLAEYGLTPVDQSGEISRAKEALTDIDVSVLPSDGKAATLRNLVDALREHEYDIVYLVCHGALVDGNPWLWLESDPDSDPRTNGNDLIARFRELPTRPRLFVLASCDGAKAGEGDALVAIGPRLAGSGIPAVLAMQGQIQMKTIERFMPVFFQELDQTGEIDHAVARARGEVTDQPDYWMPALFMRLKSGRIWYVPGFGSDKDAFKKWADLRTSIKRKKLTPILGPALSEHILGSRQDIAGRWAERHGFPLSGADRDLLPVVAQYVQTTHSQDLLPSDHQEMLRETLVKTQSDLIEPDLLGLDYWTPDQLVGALENLIEHHFEEHPDDLHLGLARLGLPLYVVTSPYDIMYQALRRQEGVEPVMRVCPWNDLIDEEHVIYEEELNPQRPLVYHLYGHLAVENSLVYSEDDYFDFLIGTTRNKEDIPSKVGEALANSSLLFQGFTLEDREFRIFFRFVMAHFGSELLRRFSHAAVQLDPAEESMLDVRRAHEYLEQYFDKENIDTFWGTADEFMTQLTAEIQAGG
jgi:hypothetical protein